MRYSEVGEKMKFTLKNRPKRRMFPNEFWIPQIDEWFKGFENELREHKLFKIEKLRNPDEIIIMTKRKFCEDFNREIKEILGRRTNNEQSILELCRQS